MSVWQPKLENECNIFIYCFIRLCFLFFPPLHPRCIERPFGIHFPSLAGCDGPHTHTRTRFLSHVSAHMARQPLFEWEPTLQALFCGFFTFQPQCQIIVYVPLTAQSQFVPTNVAPHYGTLEICVSTAQAAISWKKYSETHSALDSNSSFFMNYNSQFSVFNFAVVLNPVHIRKHHSFWLPAENRRKVSISWPY